MISGMVNFNAAVLREIGKYPSLSRITFVGPLVHRQVLVRILVSGICGKQIEEYLGHFGHDPYLPHMLGHEGVGIIEAVGPGVDDLCIGDKVVLHWLDAYPDLETPLPQFFENGARVNAGYLTTLAEYCVTRSNKLTKIPKDYDHEKMYLLGCGFTTGFGSVMYEANVKPGDTCLIVGLGGVGLSVAMGVSFVQGAVFDALDIKRESHILASFYRPRRLFSNLTDLMLSSRRYDRIFYCIGSGEGFADVYSLLKPEGVLVMVGVPNSSTVVSLPLLSIHRRKALTGSHGGSVNPRVDIPAFAEKIHNQEYDVGPLVGPSYPLSEIRAAFQAARHGSGRVRVICGEN